MAERFPGPLPGSVPVRNQYQTRPSAQLKIYINNMDLTGLRIVLSAIRTAQV